MENKNLLKRALIISGAVLVLAACSPEKKEGDVRRDKKNIEEARRNIEEVSNEQPLDKTSVKVEENNSNDVLEESIEEDILADSNGADSAEQAETAVSEEPENELENAPSETVANPAAFETAPDSDMPYNAEETPAIASETAAEESTDISEAPVETPAIE
ncbi:MAG: hypothetical protein WC371_03355 [Parachlamydiales bacterium]|jgi:hypothetical protein